MIDRLSPALVSCRLGTEKLRKDSLPLPRDNSDNVLLAVLPEDVGLASFAYLRIENKERFFCEVCNSTRPALNKH